MLRKALLGIGSKTKSQQTLSHANLQKERDKASREIKQLQVNNGRRNASNNRRASGGGLGIQEEHSNGSIVSNVSNDSQQYSSMTYTYSTGVGSAGTGVNQNPNRVKQFCEYIQSYCPPVEGRFMIMNVERLFLQPHPVMHDAATDHVLGLLDKFQKLLQAAGVDHYEWVEFTAGRNLNHHDFRFDGDGNAILNSNHAKASTLMKLNLTQFMLELDRLCSDLHYDKFSEDDSKLLFYTIAKGNLGVRLPSSIGNATNHGSYINETRNVSGSRSLSDDSHDGVPSGASVLSNSTLPRPLSNSILSQVYVDHCNLDITFKKFHSYVMQMKKHQAVYHQLMEIGNFMRVKKVRFTGGVSKTNRNVSALLGARSYLKLADLEKLVSHLLNQYDSFVEDHRIIDKTSLIPIDAIISAGCYDENENDPNIIFFQENPIPPPVPAVFFSIGSKSGSQRASSIRKKRSSSFSLSFKSAVSALGSLIPSIGVGTTARQIFPAGSVDEDNSNELSLSSLHRRLQEDKDMDRDFHHLPRVISEGVIGVPDDEDDSVKSFKHATGFAPIESQDTEMMDVEELDDQLMLGNDPRRFGINGEFVNHMEPAERQHFNKFLKNMIEGDIKQNQTKHPGISTAKGKIYDDVESEIDESKKKDIQKRYRVLKVAIPANDSTEEVKHVSDVLPFTDSNDNSHSKGSSQISRENSGWVYLQNFSGKFNTGFSDKYLMRSNANLNCSIVAEVPINDNDDSNNRNLPLKGGNPQGKSILQSFNARVSRARSALLKIK